MESPGCWSSPVCLAGEFRVGDVVCQPGGTEECWENLTATVHLDMLSRHHSHLLVLVEGSGRVSMCLGMSFLS